MNNSISLMDELVHLLYERGRGGDWRDQIVPVLFNQFG